jgi:hypothetical protein
MFDEIAAEENERRRHGRTMATTGVSAAIESPAESRLMSSLLARLTGMLGFGQA